MKLTEREINYITIMAMEGKNELELAINQIAADTTKPKVYTQTEVLTAYVMQTSNIIFDSLPELFEI